MDLKNKSNAPQFNLKHLSSILDHTPIGLNVFELLDEEKLEFKYAYVNDQQCRITGYDLKKYLGLTIRDAFPSFYSQNDGLPSFCLEVLKKGQKMYFGEFEYGDKAIESRRYNVTGIPMSATSILVCTEDIEELKSSQTDLEESNKNLAKLNYRLEKITATSPEIIYVYDMQEQRNTYANRSLSAELGYSEREVQEMGSQFFSLIVHPDDLPRVYAHHANILPQLNDEDIVKLEYRMLHKKSEKYVWLQSTESIFERDETGNVKTTIGIARNISQEKDAQQKLEQANANLAIKVDQLSILNEELNAFNYSVSHDLRQPVRSIHGLTQVLQIKLANNIEEEEQNLFSEIQRQTKKIDLLLQDLLKYTQISNKILEAKHVNMEHLCQDIFDSMQTNIDEHNIEFRMESLPSTHGDSTLLASLWNNLLSNAIKYRSKDRSLNIEVGSVSNDNKIYITYFVKDNGIGFSPEYADKVFNLFERLETNNDISGSGAGLYIANKIVRKHKGKIWAESEINKGSTFYFSLPTIEKPSDKD